MFVQDQKLLQSIVPESPFVWPEPWILANLAQYQDNPPYITLMILSK